MVQRLLRILSLLQWLGAFALALWAWRGGPAWAAWAAVGVLLLPAAVLALQLAIQVVVQRRDPAPRATLGQVLNAWWGETCAFWRVFGWQQAWRVQAHPDHLPAGQARRGVVLIHGFMCNRGFWNAWMPRLRALGVPHVAVTLEPAFGSIDAYADVVQAAVERVRQATGMAPVLVGHSMGGLAIRAWMRAQGARVGPARDAPGAPGNKAVAAVTIGTPHRGTWLGRFSHMRNGRQMRLQGGWLQALDQAESAQAHRHFVCFYSHGDNIVFPVSSATLPGARNVHLPGMAHVHLIEHPQVFDEVLALAGHSRETPSR